MASSLKDELVAAQKAAMKARDKQRLGAIRLILTEVKRIEVDERIELDDARILAILNKMSKQRRDSISQFNDAGRDDLATIEREELDVIQTFMPQQMSEAEVFQAVTSAVSDTGAESMADMGKVMAILKPQLAGKADMAVVSGLVKAALNR